MCPPYVEKKVVPLQAVDEPSDSKMLNGIPTDVIETRRFISSFDDVYAPGASIGVEYEDAPNVPLALDGTLSAIVKVGNI